MGDLSGRRALVTGAGRGIGAAVARRLADEGASVAVNYRSSAEDAVELVSDLESRGSRAVALQADVSDPSACRPLIDRVVAALGGVDVLVCNAGLEHFGSLDAITPDDFTRVFAVNVGAQLFCVQAAAARMGDGGRIVCTSSVSARTAVFEHALYAASKAAVSAMVRNLAPELAQRGRLERLTAIGSTGSPLSPEGFAWVSAEFGDSVWLFSTSGGTDVCTPFVGGTPLKPVRLGELQARHLGVAVQAWDDDGVALVDEVGELVVTQPMPSMPVRFWNDPDGERYRESYFEMYPGVWRHGDWIRLTSAGGAVVYGRSDATINRGGIRMGTAEIYGAVLQADEIVDALVVDVPDPAGTGASWMGLFVVLRDGAVLDDELRRRLAALVRADASPRHVPDEVVEVAEIPRTHTGKLLEVPVKKVLMGRDPDSAASRDALANPEAFDWFVRYARERSATGH